MAIWNRFKSDTTTADTITVTFDESTPLDNTHTLVALIHVAGTDTSIASNSWSATPLSGSGNNGSLTYLGCVVQRGNGSLNSITINLTSALYISVQLYAFEGYSTLVPQYASGSSNAGTSSPTPTATATTAANTIAIASWGLNGSAGGWSGVYDSGFISPLPTTSARHMSAVNAYTSTGATPSTSTSWTTSRTLRTGMWVIEGVATTPPPADVTSPTVTIVDPADNATVLGSYVLRATANDNVGVQSVAFYAGDLFIGNATFTSGEWRLTADTTAVPDGVYLLRAIAKDAANNTAAYEHTVTVQNEVYSVGPIRVSGQDANAVRIGGQSVARLYLAGEVIVGEPYIPPVAPPSGIPTRVTSYGPNGSHYPSRTPWAGSSTWDYDVTVACSWSAISSAINTAATSYPNGKCRIQVMPGTLPGNGAGSTSTPVIQNVGALNRAFRILVVPRDGAFSITHSASARLEKIKGVTFLGFSTWSLGQDGADASSLVITNSQDVAWGWSKGRAFNITSNAANSSFIEYVECVAPESELNAADRSATRNANGYATSNVSYVGCYLAPMHKPAGSSAHCDTLQFSGNSTSFKNIYFTDTAIFGSTNAALIMTGDGTSTSASDSITFNHALICGGTAATVAYPFLPGAYNTSGPTVGFNSKPTNCVAQNATLILGKIVPTFASVSSDSRSSSSAPAPQSGTWTADSNLGASQAWFNTNAPKPTDSTLQSMWAW
ncbi:MAG: Ig-like domain-containing protein [Candidatus Microsaccharimonas sp.]